MGFRCPAPRRSIRTRRYASPMTGRPAALVDPCDRLRSEYLEAVLAPDARGARRLIQEAVADGLPVGAVYLRVLQPVMEEVGRRWERAELTVAGEHLATQITQAVLAGLAAELAPGEGGRGRKAVVSCTPGELHAIGGQMVSDFLEADGWEVLTLGADVPADALAELVAAQDIEVVALSTALPANLLAVSSSCTALKRLERPPFIVAGGRAFGGDPARAEMTGADAYAADPEQLLGILADRLP